MAFTRNVSLMAKNTTNAWVTKRVTQSRNFGATPVAGSSDIRESKMLRRGRKGTSRNPAGLEQKLLKSAVQASAFL